MAVEPTEACTKPSTSDEKEMPCTDEGWPRAVCICGVTLEQSRAF
jgi:hypothetical protein